MKIYRHKTIACTVNESYEFILLEQFKREAKKLKLTESDIEELKHAIATEPPEASLGSGVYKFRWSPNRWNRGQSGATRTIYIEVIQDTRVYLVSIYNKNKKSTLSDSEESAIREVAKQLRRKGAKR